MVVEIPGLCLPWRVDQGFSFVPRAAQFRNRIIDDELERLLPCRVSTGGGFITAMRKNDLLARLKADEDTRAHGMDMLRPERHAESRHLHSHPQAEPSATRDQLPHQDDRFTIGSPVVPPARWRPLHAERAPQAVARLGACASRQHVASPGRISTGGQNASCGCDSTLFKQIGRPAPLQRGDFGRPGMG